MKSRPIITITKTETDWKVELSYFIENRAIIEETVRVRTLSAALEHVREHVIMGRIVL